LDAIFIEKIHLSLFTKEFIMSKFYIKINSFEFSNQEESYIRESGLVDFKEIYFWLPVFEFKSPETRITLKVFMDQVKSKDRINVIYENDVPVKVCVPEMIIHYDIKNYYFDEVYGNPQYLNFNKIWLIDNNGSPFKDTQNGLFMLTPKDDSVFDFKVKVAKLKKGLAD
jgi:hypothetical protein